MAVFEARRGVSAPRAIAWEVISDVEHFADYAPNLSSTHVVSGSGKGMKRTCSNRSGESWTEDCTLWEDGRAYTFRVDTSRYPYPLTKMEGQFEVSEAPGGSVVRVRFDYKLKYGLLGSALGVALRPVFRRTCKGLLDNWEAAIDRAVTANLAQAQGQVRR